MIEQGRESEHWAEERLIDSADQQEKPYLIPRLKQKPKPTPKQKQKQKRRKIQ